MPNDIGGELLQYRTDYYDERGWTDLESATSDKKRLIWAVEAGKSYIRVQNIGNTSKVFPAEVQANTLDITTILIKDPVTGFPGIFYYNVLNPVPVAPVTPSAEG